jgi:nucleoside-diphosphate-sugar epimerase
VHVFVTGATGYLGRHLLPKLVARGHRVAALVRPGSRWRFSEDCRVVVGEALDAPTFSPAIGAVDALVHLVGVAHPNPRKGAEFQEVDLASVRSVLAAAIENRVPHFIYVSVAQPAPVMHAYQAARAAGEALIRASGIDASILRPWYVLGPGHRWPMLLAPCYALLARLPSTRETAQRLALLNIDQMIAALVLAIEQPPVGVRVWDVSSMHTAGQRDREAEGTPSSQRW